MRNRFANMKIPMYAAFAAAALLVACGGGGGGITPPTGGPSPTPTATQTPSTTTAQGTLVDDASGQALAGQTVRLDPWIVYATPGPTPTPLLTTTTDANGHFTITAPNGTYLLVIGPDAVNTPPPGWSTPSPNVFDTPIPGASGWYATVHDRIVLSGQTTLVAPTMPPQAYYTPTPSEKNGYYRLTTLDTMAEAPCILAYNQQRASHGMPAAVADEWLAENTRAIASAVMAGAPAGTPESTIGGQYAFSQVSGGANCANDLVGYGPNYQPPSQAGIANAQWFGGIYDKYTAQHSGFGIAESIVDPRVYTQQTPPGAAMWP